MDYKNLASSILKEVGGNKNIEKVMHCATRLRFTLKDESKANAEAIKEIKGVSGLVKGNGQFQVIIGPNVSSVYAELMKLGVSSSEEEETKKKGNILENVMDFIASSFTPIVGTITAGGMLQVLLSILVMAGVLTETSDTYLVLYQVSQAAFYFLPIYLGSTVAKKFRIDPILGSMLGGVLVLPGMATLLGQEGGITLFNIALPNATYSSSVVPIILGVWFMSYIYKFCDKYLPNAIKFILRPLITLVITVPVVLIVLGPIGTYIGEYLATFLNFLTNNYGALAVMFMGAFAQIIVMTGMHYALSPILIASIAAYGFDSLIVPGMLMGIIAQAAVCLVAGIRTKDKEFKQVCFSCATTSFFGISEPGLYGVTLKLKKPLIAIIIAGACGGLYLGITGVHTSVLIASIASLPSFMTEMSNFYNACIGIIICFTVSFVISWFLLKDINKEEKKVEETKVEEKKDFAKGKTVSISACTEGQLVPLNEVQDSAFASYALGKGIAFESETGVIVSPVEGKITALFPTKHAVGITTNEGVELLIHIGINTVSLGGEGFKAVVEEGQTVKVNDELVHFDRALIKQKGLETTTMLVVVNTNDFLDVLPQAETTCKLGQELLKVVM